MLYFVQTNVSPVQTILTAVRARELENRARPETPPSANGYEFGPIRNHTRSLVLAGSRGHNTFGRKTENRDSNKIHEKCGVNRSSGKTAFGRVVQRPETNTFPVDTGRGSRRNPKSVSKNHPGQVRWDLKFGTVCARIYGQCLGTRYAHASCADSRSNVVRADYRPRNCCVSA